MTDAFREETALVFGKPVNVKMYGLQENFLKDWGACKKLFEQIHFALWKNLECPVGHIYKSKKFGKILVLVLPQHSYAGNVVNVYSPAEFVSKQPEMCNEKTCNTTSRAEFVWGNTAYTIYYYSY